MGKIAYKYDVLTFDNLPSPETLDRLAAEEGWRMIQIVPRYTGYMVYFERAVSPEAPDS